MSLTSRLLSSQHSLLRKSLPLKKIGEGVRSKHVVATPSTNKMSTAELVATGVTCGIIMWAYPAWVLYHLPDYQQEDRHKYTGK